MTKIRNIAAKLKAETQIVVVTRVLEMVEADKALLLQLNKQQLFESTDAKGKPLGNYKNLPYARKKGRTTIDYKLTGDWQDSIFIETKEFPVVFGARDFKSKWILKRSPDALGLDQKSLNVYIQGSFKKRFAAYFRALLHV